jgi:formate dehydrogenase (NADP+) beta subunit
VRDASGAVTGVTFRRCRRVYDEQRRFNPVFDDAERRTVACDTVLVAAGQTPRVAFLADGGTDIEESRPGWPRVDPATLMTTAPGVFVAGDLAHGTRLLIDAVASGKRAAREVYRWVTGRRIAFDAVETHLPLERYRREFRYEAIARVELSTRAPGERLADPGAPVELGYDEASARREASRCLDCGVAPVFDGTRCVLCGGCVDVCPTSCLTLVPLAGLEPTPALEAARHGALGADAAVDDGTAIVKDEDRCIRCALCAIRCPVDAITMERVQFSVEWSLV